ncbi:hypothetical protein BOX15_Mlig005991g1 [Macrostomum lignano]|uniref:Ras-GEF domain-containing protein n=2 Tax=Macrostomum lignano TaxID=282301 RepID=A0A267H0A2_9PLAT|nr:hypothetical protein BOX15_Mlig005991g1 [Macrostomum lignano]
MIRSESFTDVGDAESPEPVDRGARGHRRVQFVRMTSRSCEDVGAADAGNAASSCSKVHSEGVGSTGLVAAKPSIKDDTAEEERKRRIARGLRRQPSVAKATTSKPMVAITNTALYEDDGRDYTDPAQLNVLYPAERVDPALAPYLDMSRPAESLLLMTSSMVTSGVYADLSGTASGGGGQAPSSATGSGSWQLANQWQYAMSRPMLFPELHNFQFLDEPSKALDNKLVDLIAELLASQSARDLAVHLFYYDYVYLLENYDTQLLPGLYCRLQTIVFDEAGELRRFLFFRHNLLRCLVSLTVLSRRTTRERVKLLSVWIEVLFLLRNEFKDLFAYRSVLMALTSSQVLSLTHSWRLLESHDKTRFGVFQKQTREFRRFRCVVDPADKRVIYDLIPLVKFPAHLYTFSFEGHDKQIEDTTMDELVNLELMLQRYSFDGNSLHSVMEHCRTLMKMQSLIPMVKEIFSSETLLKVLMDPAMSEVPTVERFSELCQSLEASMTSMAARAGFTP